MQTPEKARDALLRRAEKFAIKAAGVYRKLNWQWFSVGASGVPNSEEIARHCERLIWDVWQELEKSGPPVIISAGGVCCSILRLKAHSAGATEAWGGSLKLVAAEEHA